MQGAHVVAPLPLDLKRVLEQEPLWNQAVEKEPRLLLEPYDEQGGTFGRNYRRRRRDESVHEGVQEELTNDNR